MTLFTPLPAGWHSRINYATAPVSVAILLVTLALRLPFELPESLGYALNPAVLAMAAVHAFYTLALYRFVAKRNSQLASVIGFVLYLMLVGLIIEAASAKTGAFVSLWTVALFIAGAYGPVVLGLLGASSVIYFALAQTGTLGSYTEYRPLSFGITLVSVAISFLFWNNISQETSPFAKGLRKRRGKDDKVAIDPELLITAMGDGVLVIDTDGIIQVFNPSAATITGWKQEEALSLDYKSVMALTDAKGNPQPDTGNPFLKCLQSGEVVKSAAVFTKTRSGKQLDLSLVVSPIKSPEGGVVAAIGIFRDVSEERSEQRQRAEFISTASHEMRTPVAAIEGYLALAMNERVAKIDSNARNYLQKAHSSTEHLGKLFKDLLTAARSEDGRLVSSPKVIEVGSFLEEISEGIRFAAEKKGLGLEFDYTGKTKGPVAASGQTVRPVYYVQADPDRMREVITNLFDNAVKYTEEGKITISMTSDEQTVTISVTDTGIGIPPEDIPHLFQKFYRVDNTATRAIGGTGLGLFIARKIVELYNGRVWVESKYGEGSTFHIQLPRLTPEKAQEFIKQESSRQSPLGEIDRPSTTVTPTTPPVDPNQPPVSAP